MRRNALLFCLLLLNLSLFATTWQVGPSRTYNFCSQVAPLVQDGDTVAIDSAIYVNYPQVTWNKDNLFITGVGGRPRLEAGAIIANDMTNGKGIFVISGNNVHVHNIEFANAVVQDNNGAGIRQEGQNLWVDHCRFVGNENGILAGNKQGSTILIEYSEFFNGGSTLNPGFQHNLYVNHVDTLIFRYNYSVDAIAEGHELKSRADYNFILYNRIANEQSADSRTIDLPNGGTSVIVGNIIEQGPTSVNSNLIGYGLEGLSNPAPHRLFCGNNTFINRKTTGSFIQIASGTDTLWVKNNIFAGAKTGGLFIGSPTVLDSSNNLINDAISVFGFLNAPNFDYHLQAGSPAVNAGTSISRTVQGYALQAQQMYRDLATVEPRPVDASLDVGAFEYLAPVARAQPHAAPYTCFPNPTSGQLQVHVAYFPGSHHTFQLHNAFGAEVFTRNLYLGHNQLDISKLSRGIYYLRIGGGRDAHVEKIILQ